MAGSGTSLSSELSADSGQTNNLEEKGESSDKGITQTGLITNYWKNEARQPNFWREHPDHGMASRQKPLFKDDYMSLFAPKAVADKAKAMIEPKLALALAVRHKYFNKVLSKGVKSEDKGTQTRQIVILGSGYDTRPVRKQKYSSQYNAKFFEIDNKEVLANKKSIYEQNKINPNAVYIGIDYVQEDFIEHLKKAGLDTALPTHFIWEGNTMYLSEEVVASILEKIKKDFSGSVLMSFDYLSRDMIKKVQNASEMNSMLDKFKKSKAPMINGYNDIRTELADKLGLTVIENGKCAGFTKQYGVGDNPYVSQEAYSFCTLRMR